MTNLTHIAENIDRIRAAISAAAARAGRSPDDITLVAVTKTYPTDFIAAAVHAGVTNAGENRVQEALPKIEALSNDLSISQLRWHLIGHLQSNKAKQAVLNFDMIHSVDSLKLAREISRHAADEGRTMPILLQVNISGEESKSGLSPVKTELAVEQILETCPNVTVEGFMTMAALTRPEESRETFKGLRELKNRIKNNISHSRFPCEHLSMGMSNDFGVAIEEGATLVRVGSSIFGNRRA